MTNERHQTMSLKSLHRLPCPFLCFRQLAAEPSGLDSGISESLITNGDMQYFKTPDIFDSCSKYDV